MFYILGHSKEKFLNLIFQSLRKGQINGRDENVSPETSTVDRQPLMFSNSRRRPDWYFHGQRRNRLRFSTGRHQPWKRPYCCFLLVNVGRHRPVENISLVEGWPRMLTIDAVDVRFYWCFHHDQIYIYFFPTPSFLPCEGCQPAFLFLLLCSLVVLA